MSDKIYPAFSKLDQNEVELFRQSFPQYDTPENLQVLQEFCSLHCVPCNLYNLTIGMHDAVADGRLEKSNQEEIEAATAFLKACPEYDQNFASRKNSDVLVQWLKGRNLGVTVENLLKAFEACVKNRTIRPTKEGQGIIDLNKAVFVREAITSEDREKWADKPYESDVARKKRDEALRRAALADRYKK